MNSVKRVVLISSPFFIFLAFYFFVLLPGVSLGFSAKQSFNRITAIKGAVEARQYEKLSEELSILREDFPKLKDSYRRFSYLRFVPRLNRYYQDGLHLLEAASHGLAVGEGMVELLSPFESIMGAQSGFGGLLTTRDYLDRFIQILPSLTGEIDEVAARLFLLEKELAMIDPTRYPNRLGEELTSAQNLLADIRPLLEQAKPLLEVLPHLLGVPSRQYLIIFQNDAELRPTGGFITATSLIEVRNGEVGEIESHNIGYVENRTPDEPVPAPYRRYLKVPSWGFRDANLSPDFRVAAEKALSMWRGSSSLPQDVDFIIAVTPEAGQKLLEFTGPITLPGYSVDLAASQGLPPSCRTGGISFTAENLTCKLEFYIEDFYAANPERKGVIGELSEILLGRIFAAPKERWPQLLSIILEMLEEKTVLLYSADPREQALIELLGYGGRILDDGGDYLHISDSNLGGRKTDLVMQEEVEQELIRLEDGRWRKTVKLHYYNPQPYDNWMSANYKDWVRIYVPKGSRLISVEGAREIWTSPERWSWTVTNPAGWEELGKTVFGAYFTLWPQRKHNLTFTYDLPKGVVNEGEYRLLIQKQPGTNITLAKVEIGGKIKSFDLRTDKEITLSVGE